MSGRHQSPRRNHWWLAVVIIVVAVVLLWPKVLHERIEPVCETCGAPATTALPHDGLMHAYCAEHGQPAASQEGYSEPAD